jgi:hypothetical protein
MKLNFFAFLFTGFCLLLNVGCSKSSTTDPSPTPAPTDPLSLLQHKWQVVKDVCVVNNFAFPNGDIPLPGVYYGTANDYFDFRADGNVYIYESLPVGNSPYQLLSPTSLLITKFEWGDVTILTLTSNALSYEKSMTSPNGGTYYRKVDFRR